MTEVVVSSGPLTRSSSAAASAATAAMTTRSARQQTQTQIQTQNQHQHETAAVPIASTTTDSPSSASSSFRGPMTRKRAASINTEEASHSHHPRIQDLSLNTPNTASPNNPPPPSSSESNTPRDLICLCTPAPKVPRPRNAFILYRQHRQAQVVAQNPGLANPEISKIIGDEWRSEPEERKNQWKQLAEEEKQRHARQYPDYRYQPRRGNKGAPPRLTTSSGGGGEDPGHCPKCGGRYIATPRTPLTPFVSPPLSSTSPASKTWSMAHSSHPHPHSNAGMARPDLAGGEAQYYRHGSSQQPVSALRARGAPWHGHAGLHEIHEEYDTMAMPVFPSEPKRRRYNAPMSGSAYHGYQALPSPPGTYGGSQRSRNSSVSGGPLPTPSMLAHSGPGPVLTPVQGHMGPPPRPGAMSRHEFEDRESLRLPPLQTQQLPTSPGSDKSMTYYHVPPSQPQHGQLQTPQHPHQQHSQHAPQQAVPTGVGHDLTFEERLMSIPFYNKLMALEKISPRLPPPNAAATRGPIIAVEGPDPNLLRIVGPAVERALLASRECDVRSWYPPSPGDHNPEDAQMSDRTPTQQQPQPPPQSQHSAGTSRSGSVSNISGGLGGGPGPKDNPFVAAFQSMIQWHAKSAEMVRFVSLPQQGMSESNNNKKLPVALLPAGYSLTQSDRAAVVSSGTDHYEFIDHWQWTGSLWRGVAGPDLVIYVTHIQAQAQAGAGDEEGVEVKAPGLMVVKLRPGEALSEKTERRLGFEVVEWVRGGAFWLFWRGVDGGSSSSS